MNRRHFLRAAFASTLAPSVMAVALESAGRGERHSWLQSWSRFEGGVPIWTHYRLPNETYESDEFMDWWNDTVPSMWSRLSDFDGKIE